MTRVVPLTLVPTKDHRYPKDALGNVVKIGDVIAYAVSVSSSASLNFGKVADLPVHEETYYVDNGTKDARGWPNKDRKVRTYSKLKVQPWDVVNDQPVYESEWDSVNRVSLPTTKPVGKRTLQDAHRAVVIGN
jgi:hypothetical protein